MVLRRHVEPLGESCRGDLGVHAASLEHSDSRPSKISAKPANASSTTVEVGVGCFHANISMAPTAKATVAQWRSMTFPRRMRRRLAPSDDRNRVQTRGTLTRSVAHRSSPSMMVCFSRASRLPICLIGSSRERLDALVTESWIDRRNSDLRVLVGLPYALRSPESGTPPPMKQQTSGLPSQPPRLVL